MKPFRTTWTEFQGDSANSGYAAQRTGGFSDVRWRRRTLSPGGGSPIIDPLDDSIYLTDGIGVLWKYRSLNGAELWTRRGGNNHQWGSTPAIDNAGPRVRAVFKLYGKRTRVLRSRRKRTLALDAGRADQ
jgi:hypothetical protein